MASLCSSRAVVFTVTLNLVACAPPDGSREPGTGGREDLQEFVIAGAGGADATNEGGMGPVAGSNSNTGGTSTGGTPAMGGNTSSGGMAGGTAGNGMTGGAGGDPMTGGSMMGGAMMGGMTMTGGMGGTTGGAMTGGSMMGGMTGGAMMGGAMMGGMTGGSMMGGMTGGSMMGGAPAPVTFVNRSNNAALDTGPLESLVVVDFNGDGYPDLAKSNWMTAISIAMNDRDLTFSTSAGQASARGIAWGDYDDDGDIDLVTRGPILWSNGGNGTFTRRSLPNGNNGEAVFFIDFDGDGDLDILEPGTAQLWYRNDGNGTFVAQTQYPGAGPGNLNGEGSSPVDLNGDGYLDFVYTSSLTSTDVALNDGDHTYTLKPNITADFGLPEQVGEHENMGWIWGDYDNDGDVDVFISGTAGVGLFDNNGSGRFTDVGSARGVTIGATTDGADWGDYDNDGDLDLLVAKGANSALYRNKGGSMGFDDVSAQVGLGTLGRVCGFADMDLDGDLDIVCGTGELWENTGGAPDRVLRVLLRGKGGSGNAPRTPIGAQVDVFEAGTQKRVGHRRQAAGFNNYQGPRLLHFGLDASASYDIRVRFPSSQKVVTRTNVRPDQSSLTIGPTTVSNAVEIVEN